MHHKPKETARVQRSQHMTISSASRSPEHKDSEGLARCQAHLGVICPNPFSWYFKVAR